MEAGEIMSKMARADRRRQKRDEQKASSFALWSKRVLLWPFRKTGQGLRAAKNILIRGVKVFFDLLIRGNIRVLGWLSGAFSPHAFFKGNSGSADARLLPLPRALKRSPLRPFGWMVGQQKPFFLSRWPFWTRLPFVRRKKILVWPGARTAAKYGALAAFELAVVAGLAVFLWYTHEAQLLKPLNLYDEGVTLMGAKRFAAGEVPYRDFFTIYGPLKFSLLGWVFNYFGASLLTSRLFFLAVSLLGFLCLFLFLRRWTNAFYAGLFTACIIPFGSISLTPLLFLMIAWWFAAQVKTPSRPLLPFVGGFLIGILFLLRIDFGGFSGLAIFVLLSIAAVFDKRWNFGTYAGILGKAGCAFSLTVMPVFIMLSLRGALADFWRQAVYFPIFGTYQELRHLPWAAWTAIKEPFNGYAVDFLLLSERVAWFFWPLPFLIGAVYFFWRAVRRDFPLTDFVTNALWGAFTVAAFIYSSHRSDMGHVQFLNLIALLYLLHLLALFKNRLTPLLFLPLIALIIFYPAIELKSGIEQAAAAPKKTYSFFPYAFPASQENDNLDQTLAYFKKVDPTKKVYVGITDTSRVFVNNVMLPFLLEQPTVTRYHELHTGIVTTAPVQAEMLDELSGTDYVVLWDLFFCEPNRGCESTNVRLVDEYIGRNFTKVAEYGKYKILRKNAAF